MALLAKAENTTIEIHENYIKQNIRNRYFIYSANGKQMLTIPVIKTNGNHTPTQNMRICYQQAWQNLHYKALCAAYNHSPFFEYYIDEVFAFFNEKPDTLVEMNQKMLVIILKLLGIKVRYELSADYQKEIDPQQDYRNFDFQNPPISHEVFPRYIQVFEPKFGFLPNVSVLDVLFNLGKEGKEYLAKVGECLNSHPAAVPLQ